MKIYVYGGQVKESDSPDAYNPAMWIYHIGTKINTKILIRLKEKDEWKKLEGTAPPRRRGHSANLICSSTGKTQILIFGGSCCNTLYNDLWVFDVGKHSFEHLLNS